METNENHALTKAEGCYHCKPLVEQRDELAELLERVSNHRDKLMAQNARLSSVIRAIRVAFDDAAPERAKSIDYGIGNSWAESLSALKAQWQAEAVHDFEAMLSSFLSLQKIGLSNAHRRPLMAVHELVYLTCSECGEVFKNEDGTPMYMETPEEVRDEVEVCGWLCYVGEDKTENQRDYCPNCKHLEAGDE